MLYGEHSPAHANPQLFTLASLVMQENKSIQECFIALVTPLLDPLYSVSMLTRDLVEEWTEKLYKLSKTIQNPEAVRRAGVKQCKYCRALPYCPEARQLLDSNMDNIEELSKDPDALGEIYALAPMYEKFAASIKATVRSKLKDDNDLVTGYKLGRGTKLTQYDSEKALEALRAEGFDSSELDTAVKLQERNIVSLWAEKHGISVPQARKALRELMTKKDALSVKEGMGRIIKEKPTKEEKEDK